MAKRLQNNPLFNTGEPQQVQEAAFDVEKEEAEKITYTDRFPKPYWVD